MNGAQVRSLFYVKNLCSSNTPAAAGDLKIVAAGAKLSGEEAIQLQYVNPDGKLIVSDFIVKGKAKTASVTGTATRLKKAVLSLNGSLVAGEDYIVDILVHNYLILDDNSVLAKFGAVHATAGMATSEFMVKLAKSFAGNFRRDADLNVFFKFYVCAAANKDVKANWKEVQFDTAYDGSGVHSGVDTLIIEEQEQPTWYRGTFPKQTVSFDVAPHTIISNGDEVQPFVTVGETGLVAIEDDKTATTPAAVYASIPNGYAIADLEYECHGDIGDQLREAGYPNNIRTKYTVSDADVTKTFDSVEVYFYYVGRNISSQKAEKQITLVVDAAGTGTIDGSSSLTASGLKSAIDSALS